MYHALNRGVEGRNLFQDEKDYARFVHDLYEFNDKRPVNNLSYRFDIKGFGNPYFLEDEREKIVDLHGWCLMKNHYHLLLSEREEGGLSLFLRKLNVGYANYFNERYERKGTLFQGKTKKIHITNTPHLLYILHYIHLNPLDYLNGAHNWRVRSKQGIKNAEKALDHLEKYRWSSYLDYARKRNFPSILTTAFFNELLEDYPADLETYLQGAEADLGLTLES